MLDYLKSLISENQLLSFSIEQIEELKNATDEGSAANILGVSNSKEVYFTLYTKDNPSEGISLTVDSVLEDSIQRNIPWKFFVHGWTTSPWVSPWFQLTRDNYFKRGEYNIVYVDWSKPAKQSYLISVLNTKASGQLLGDFILNLRKNKVPLSQIHLLGHSLGAHMASNAGRRVCEQTNEQISRITATDPAGPLFDRPILVPEEQRVDKNAASFVDVVHTDAGNYGMSCAVGHVDFYPNGGTRFQPGCDKDVDENCSHARSVYYYTESVLCNDFIARQANSYQDYLENKFTSDIEAVFGENVDTSLRGTFYFKTNSQPPYSLGP